MPINNPAMPDIIQQDTEPAIPINSEAYWFDTVTECMYRIINLDGTQFSVELCCD